MSRVAYRIVVHPGRLWARVAILRDTVLNRHKTRTREVKRCRLWIGGASVADLQERARVWAMPVIRRDQERRGVIPRP